MDEYSAVERLYLFRLTRAMELRRNPEQPQDELAAINDTPYHRQTLSLCERQRLAAALIMSSLSMLRRSKKEGGLGLEAEALLILRGG